MATVLLEPASGQVTGTHTNMPVLITPSAHTNIGTLTLTEAQSVRIYTDAAKTNEIAREVVSADEIHAKVPSLSSSTTLYFDWDGIRADYAVTDTYGRNAVWSDYIGVYHQQMSSGDAVDSTGNDDLTAVGTVTYSQAGQIGDAVSHPGTTNNKFSQTTSVAGTTVEPLSLQAWARPDVVSGARSLAYMGSASGEHGILFVNNAAWALSQAGGSFPSAQSGAILSANTYYLVHGVFAANNSREIYVNGTSQATNATNIAVPAGSGMAIGDRLITNQAFDGRLDEIRYRASALSADWITTEYNNQNNNAAFWDDSPVGGGGIILPQFLGFAGL